MAPTALVIPVPEAEPLVRAVSARQTPGLAVADDDVMAHVTLLSPFLPLDRVDESVLRELATFFAGIQPFSYRLVEVQRFPGGAVYLVPEPEEPFRAITIGLALRFPETPPYGGQFEHVIPHLTVGFARDEATEQWLRDEAARFGPISARAVEGRLVEADETFLATRHRFPFGQAGNH
jgi:2'-5' RNA ligase superfamily